MFTRRWAYPRRDRVGGDVGPHVDKALDGDLPHVQRIGALWSLAHLPAFIGTGHGALACVVGQLLDHPSPLLAREAYEVLCTLSVVEDGVFALPELALCVGKRNGRVAVSPRQYSTCEVVSAHPPRAWCPDLDVEVCPLVSVGALLDAAAGHGLVVNASATDLLVIRGARIYRMREHGPLLLRDMTAPRVSRRERNVWSAVPPPRFPLVVDGVPASAEGAVLNGHHAVRWSAGEARVVVVPALHVSQRVAIELPPDESVGGAAGPYDAVHEGDAWFSMLKHARGHVALRDGKVIVVDTTASEPHVAELLPGDASTFGLYDVEFATGGRLLRISTRSEDGPTRASGRAAAAKREAAKKAA